MFSFLPGCGRRLPTYRYRMTVEVETPEGLKTGSSVIEVRTTNSPAFPGPEAGGTRTRVKGEAVIVDLGEAGLLFALLRGQSGDVDAAGFYAADTLLGIRMNTGSAEDRREKIRRLMAVERKGEIRPNRYPMLVRFRDIDDPTTVERVDPDNLAASFGEGYRLRRITVAITDDRVSEGIEERLDWLGTTVTGYLDGAFSGGGPELSNILDTTAFRRGD